AQHRELARNTASPRLVSFLFENACLAQIEKPVRHDRLFLRDIPGMLKYFANDLQILLMLSIFSSRRYS
nr:hypothetical protein [Treponemataceae bacterium]